MLVLGFDGWDHSDRGVQASVAEPIDVLGHGGLEVIDRSPRPAVPDELGLEQRVEGFGEGVVVAVASGSDGCDRAGLGEPFG